MLPIGDFLIPELLFKGGLDEDRIFISLSDGVCMNNSEAWHWAAVDAGLAQIPRYRSDKIPKVGKPIAEKLGVTDVEWKPA